MHARPLIFALATIANPVLAQQAPIDRVAWLAGCWELRAPGRVINESWMTPLGGTMMGMSRTVSGSATREFEHLRISTRGDTLVYTSIPSGQRLTDFKTTGGTDSLVAFENPAHDFPQRIIYRRVAPDSIVARIEALTGPNGSSFPMRRVNCSAVPAAPPPAAPPPAPTDSLVFDADVSPDGKQMAVVKGWGQNWDVYITSIDGKSGRNISNHTAIDYMPAWSPDGKRLAFASAREGHQEIYTINPDGSGLTQLTRGTAHNSEPAWSRDGRTIAFRSERDGKGRIYLMNADGSNQRALIADTSAMSAPSFSPDGKRIVFQMTRNGKTEVYVANADGSNVVALTETVAGRASGYPIFSPDGKLIAFNSNRDGNGEVYVMNADGSNQRNVTNTAAQEAVHGWTPDGQIVFRSSRDRTMFEIYRVKPDGTDVVRMTTTIKP